MSTFTSIGNLTNFIHKLFPQTNLPRIIIILSLSIIYYQYKKWKNISKKPNLYYNKNDTKISETLQHSVVFTKSEAMRLNALLED